ncbi:hypothetical protein DJ031_00115 [bacterium endosymbiont of Escarpia laminata]|nr:MAG: hypothetical protein DJ031_00115 [bacterium endosymbiont of Escarpia laminata]
MCSAVSLYHNDPVRCDVSLATVTQQGLEVGPVRVRIGRRRHERAVQRHVDLTEHRMQNIIDRGHFGAGRQIGAIPLNHFEADVHLKGRQVRIVVARPRNVELDRAAGVESRQRLVDGPVTALDARLRHHPAEQFQFGLHALASCAAIHERHR